MTTKRMYPALFLDRDGVINEYKENYIRCLEDIKILSGTIEAFEITRSLPYKIIIVTNQSVIGRGIISELLANKINCEICQSITKTGGRIDNLYMCPHVPEDGCECRKPKPGLLLKASLAHSIDLSQSILIGDSITDIIAGQNAGLKQTILVLSGRGREQLKRAQEIKLKHFDVYENLYLAVSQLSTTFSGA